MRRHPIVKRLVWLSAVLIPLGCSLPSSSASTPKTGVPPQWIPVDIIGRLENVSASDKALQKLVEDPQTEPFLKLVSLAQYDANDIVFGVRPNEVCFGIYFSTRRVTVLNCVDSKASARPLWVSITDPATGIETGAVMAPFALDGQNSSVNAQVLDAHPTVAILHKGVPDSGLDIIARDDRGTSVTYHLGK